MRRTLNTDNDKCSLAILAGYYKFYTATLLDGNYGTKGTVVIEVYETNKDRHYKQ